MTAIDESFATGTERGSAPPRTAEAPPPAPPARQSVHPDAIKAVMSADHGDPFSVLGPHQVGPGAWEVRAVLPEARSATLLVGGGRVSFERRHPDGFFVAPVKSEGRPLYEIELELWDGDVLLERVKSETAEIAKVESEPMLEGRQMIMILAPR